MGRRKTSDLRRRRPFREPKRLFILYCEGEKTEPRYFTALGRSLPDALIDIEIIKAVGVPRTIAEKAGEKAREISRLRAKNSFAKHDEVWAVFDRDDHPNFEGAIACCESRGVRVARSNPCFEVWLILHETDYDKSDGRSGVQAHLRALRPEYDPSAGKTPDCADLVTRVEDAERRAKIQLDTREAERIPFGRPSTVTAHGVGIFWLRGGAGCESRYG